MYIAAGQGRQTQGTKGQNFDVNRNLLSLRTFATSLKSEFIQFSHDFIHVYSPGAEADNSLGTKF